MHYFFMGVAGAGMSAMAQFLAGKGYKVSGSDRQFDGAPKKTIQLKLEKAGIQCFPQDTSGIQNKPDRVVVSAAVEPEIPEYKKAARLCIPIVKRSELLAEICNKHRTIAIAGTSGKSTVTAMIYEIFEFAGFSPSLITGAGLESLKTKGLIGNAVNGKSDLLIIEADESDGLLGKYKPETGIILNIEKDHKSTDELYRIFGEFAGNTRQELIVNRQNAGSFHFTKNSFFDFMSENLQPDILSQSIDGIHFKIRGQTFKMQQIGAHTAENATAAAAAALCYDIPLSASAKSLANFEGIDRRHRIVGSANNITVIDDYAHNPAKLSASLKACQAISERVLIWFQPHGFGPTRFLRNEFVKELNFTARPEDTIVFSDIYFAGGTVSKDISSRDLINDLQALGSNAHYLPDRQKLPGFIKTQVKPGSIILLCGARDPSLRNYADYIFDEIIKQL
jgi:UDP-N-acetylmuramate--alanine ligase